jgi:hypothetical protein
VSVVPWPLPLVRELFSANKQRAETRVGALLLDCVFVSRDTFALSAFIYVVVAGILKHEAVTDTSKVRTT